MKYTLLIMLLLVAISVSAIMEESQDIQEEDQSSTEEGIKEVS
tara:strand:+ start:896 stop:1024 length:129 start_codon:yes stop_codon:yes gene_type:complete